VLICRRMERILGMSINVLVIFRTEQGNIARCTLRLTILAVGGHCSTMKKNNELLQRLQLS
jgi:hypothetical protein